MDSLDPDDLTSLRESFLEWTRSIYMKLQRGGKLLHPYELFHEMKSWSSQVGAFAITNIASAIVKKRRPDLGSRVEKDVCIEKELAQFKVEAKKLLDLMNYDCT